MTEHIDQLMARGDWPGALKASQEKVVELPTSAKLHGYVGMCHFRMQQYEAAAKSFRAALTLDDKFFEVALKLAQSLDRLMRYEEALDAANHAHHLRPSDTTVNVLLHGLQRQVQDHSGDAWLKSQHLTRHNVTIASE